MTTLTFNDHEFAILNRIVIAMPFGEVEPLVMSIRRQITEQESARLAGEQEAMQVAIKQEAERIVAEREAANQELAEKADKKVDEREGDDQA